jgi:hypothetical protein
MIRRCIDERSRPYNNYGGRGITVCDKWINDPLSFYLFSVTNGWRIGIDIDRINNDGNYEPSNVRFVDRKTNNRNRRSNTHITINGETRVLAEWAELSGVSRALIAWRYKKGITGDDLLLPQFHGTLITINGETKTSSEWANIAGILRDTFMKRYNSGITGTRLLERVGDLA